jgi:hypothetical protein
MISARMVAQTCPAAASTPLSGATHGRAIIVVNAPFFQSAAGPGH